MSIRRMADEFAFEAFISYSHADHALARWLHRSLERFRIPRRLVSEQSLASNRFLPVFRDQDELAAAHHLPDVLQKALEASRYLIVVCSPDAAESEWVNKEVTAFLELDRAEQIICVLAGGDPRSPASCFPSALRGVTTPLAVDFRPGSESRRLALLRIAATLLGVGYDQLRQRAVQQHRRRLLQRGALTTCSIALIAFVSFRLANEPPCQNSADRLADVWSEHTRADMQASFLATGLPYAQNVVSNVLARLQRYHDSWIGMHREACEATMVRNEQSPRLMDLRMACLDERRQAFTSLVDVLQQANPQIVDSAVSSAGRLRGLNRCADAEQLEAGYPLPEDPQQRAKIERLQLEVAQAAVALEAGQMQTSANLIPDLLAEIATVDYPALEAEALLVKSRHEMYSGRATLARETTFDAAASAVRARDNELVARTWLSLPGIALNTEGELSEVMQLLELAGSYISQLPPGHPLEADFHGARGEVLMRQGDLDKGVLDLRAAVEISRTLNLPDLQRQLTRLAWGLSHLHEPAAAGETAGEALEIAEREFGLNHPRYAGALKEISRVHSQLGHRDEALALQSRVVAIEEALYGDADPRLATSVERLGWTYSQAGRFEDAIRQFERAIAMERGFEDANQNNIAAAYNDMGDAFISMGDYENARQALEAALNVWVEQGQTLAIGIALGNLGNASNRAGRYSEAADYCQRGYETDVRYLPENHPDLAYPLTCLGEARIGEGNPEAALEHLSQAHSLRNRLDVDEASLAWTRWLYGRALWESGTDKSTGIRYVRFAEDIFTSLGDATKSELADVIRWLDVHDIPDK